MSAHNFHNKSTLMRVSSTNDCINGLNDTVKCGVSSNCHVSTTEIVVNRSNHTSNVQRTVFGPLLLRDLSILEEFVQERCPFYTE